MARKKVISLLLVGLVALSGCTSGIPLLDEGSSELDRVEYPDGASADGINATELAQTHHDAVRRDSYRIEQTRERQVAGESASQSATITLDARDREVLASVQRGPYQGTSYYADQTAYARSEQNGSVEYAVTELNRSFDFYQDQFTGVATVRPLLERGEFEPTDIQQQDGVTLITYNLTSFETQQSQQVQQGSSANVTGALIIDTEGRIHRLQIVAETEFGRSVIRIEFSQFGTASVDRPDWVSEATQSSDGGGGESESG